MARRPAHLPLGVYLNGRRAGLFRRERTGAVDFHYDRAYLDWESAFPVSLSLPLREDRYVGQPVIAVFDNLLPDNADVRRRVAERTGAAGLDTFSLLEAIGRDCVGALQFVPEGQVPPDIAAINARPIADDEIAIMIGNLARNPLGLGDDRDFRISIAGAQEKTALLRQGNDWFMPHDTTPTTHILKPQLGLMANGLDMSHSVENEHFCMRLVDAFGLPAARTVIADFDNRRVLVVERFDRVWTRNNRLLRIPQEDFCQALSVPPSRKYQSDGGPTIAQIDELLRASDTPDVDRRTFFTAQVLFWLLAATDGHAKNFSLRLSPGGRFRMTPLYDIMSAQPAHDAGQIRPNQLKLAMSIGENNHYVVDHIYPRHFEQQAATMGLPVGTAATVFADLKARAPAAIESATSDLAGDVPAELIESIVGGLNQRLHRLA